MIFEPGNTKSTIVEMLLRNGAKVNGERQYEFPPLIPALESGKIELVKMLIDAGADVNLYHPKLQGNYAVLLCLHQWKSFNFLLRIGAELETMFDTAKYLYHVEESEKKFQNKRHRLKKKFTTVCCSKPGTSSCHEDSFSEQEIIDCVNSEEESDKEGSQIEMLEMNSFIPFDTFLVAARHVMSGGPYKIDIGSVLYKMLYCASNVNVSPGVMSFINTPKDLDGIVKLTDTTRPLAHLCRVAIRKLLGPRRLLHSDKTKQQFYLPKNIWDYLLFTELPN
jgi:hypothetical protein